MPIKTTANPSNNLTGYANINHTHNRFQPRLYTALQITLALAAIVGTSEALACASCGCTLSTDWGSQGVSTAQGFSADVSYSYINQDTLIYGNSKASGPLINSLYSNGQEIETSTVTQTTTATLNYNSDTWGMSLQLPYLNRTHETQGTTKTNDMTDYGANGATSSDGGLGDIRIISTYSGFADDKTTGLIAGVKLATGSINKNFSAGSGAGTALDAGLQLGTGSNDIILGAYTSGLIGTYGWFVQGTVQHAMTPLATEASGTYRPGDAYAFNTGIRYAGFGASVSPMLQLNFIHRNYDQGTAVSKDVFSGDPISGGNLAYLAPGVTVRVGGGISIYGFVQLPIYQNVGSLQLVPSNTATVGVHQSW